MLQRQISNYGAKRAQLPLTQQVPLDIVGGTRFGRYKKISSEETFNMMVSDDCLVPFAGYINKATIVSNGEAREIYTSNKFNHMIVVIDDGVYTVSSGLAVSKIGTLSTSAGNVFIAENLASQIAIADGINLYVFDYANNTFKTSGVDFFIDFRPVYIAFQDTYLIAADGNSNQWRLSDNNDATNWPADASHVGLLQSKPSNTVACVPLDRQLFIFGKNVAEPWYDLGYSLFPYQRNNYFNIDFGCISAETIATGFSKLVWLGSNEKGGLAIMYSQGGAPEKISNDGLDFLFSHLTRPDDSFGFLCRIDGHIFYVLTFRTDNKTYAYDFNTNQFFTLTDENLNHFIAKRIAYFNSKYYFVSFIDGNLYELDSQYTTYDTHLIPRGRICKNFRLPISDRFVVPYLVLTIEQGVNKDLQRAELSLSRDGGESYGNVMPLEFNPYGARPNLFQIWRLGMANDLTLKFQFWSAGRFVVVGGTMSVYQ